MSKIVVEKKNERVTFVNRLVYPEQVNMRAYNGIAEGIFEGILPIALRQKRKETRIECSVEGLLTLKEYFGGIVTKKMFLDFVCDLILLIKSCEDNRLGSDNLDLQSDMIFIDPQSKQVKCIFWPVLNNARSNPPKVFLKQLPDSFVFNPHEDQSYLETYRTCFKGYEPFSINSFERTIRKLAGKQRAAAPSGPLERERREEKKPEQDRFGAREYDPFAEVERESVTRASVVREPAARSAVVPEVPRRQTEPKDVFCPGCGIRRMPGAKFCMECGEPLDGGGRIPVKKESQRTYYKESAATILPAPRPAPAGGTTVLDNGFGGTTVLGEESGGTTVLDSYVEPVYPKLVRLRTEEAFIVDKPSFRIGTERKYCDLFISDNSFISRSHADIITRADRYYIIDLNSTNRTFLDGRVIPVQQELEIFSGTQIRLANEDFIFTIES